MFRPRCLRASSASSPSSPVTTSKLPPPPPKPAPHRVPSKSSNSSSPDHHPLAEAPSDRCRPLQATSPPLSDGTEEGEPIKVRIVDQRSAEPGEPLCVVCGRYGEYICDETDEDVCSLECKAAVIERARLAANTLTASNNKEHSHRFLLKPTVKTISAEEECTQGTDGQQTLLEWEPDEFIKALSKKQVEDLRKEIEVHVKGEGVPPLILDFVNCKFLPRLQDNLELAGYVSPTPVQMQAIPAALKRRDILVSADTGSGKTAAFLLPIISRCCLIRKYYAVEREKPLAIVLTPTRELCAQVEEQAKTLGKGLPFKTALVVGGDALPQQVYRIRQGIELVVGTPGRLIDLLTKHPVDLDDVCMLVLDEVDCMLERGFRDQVMQIIQALSRPQIMMFSATIPPFIERFSSSILKQPLLISVGNPSSPNGAVKQTVIWVESKHKKQKLFEILRSAHHFQPPIVVFVDSRIGADLLAEAIHHSTGLKASALHGEKKMHERRQVLSSFLIGELPVIVATGVLGRGLDLLRVRQVVVFDMPHSLQEYIHQIGRASRLGVPGTAMVFINNESKSLFKDFIQLLHTSGAVVPRELANSPYVHSSYAMAYNSKKRKSYARPTGT